jgi:hypothetical protein
MSNLVWTTNFKHPQNVSEERERRRRRIPLLLGLPIKKRLKRCIEGTCPLREEPIRHM